jgi:phage gp29-like protein
MGFRVVTESPEALHAYRKFLKAETLVETKSAGETVEQRLPAKIHKIQDELPAWIQRTGNQSLVEPLMRKLDAALRANDLEQAESVVDSILKLMSQGESKS